MKRILPILVMFPGAALAHTGHMEDLALVAGLAHPFGGLDHVLAMLAVGLWATMLGGRALWVLPVTFVSAMIAGGVTGTFGMPLPGVEHGILASTLVLGAAISLALKAPLSQAAVLVAVFGVFHGHAHGVEGPSSSLIPYAIGFALSSMILHLAGLLSGRLLHSAALRILGGATVLGGLAVAIGG